jgi:hypothetical protein
MPSLSPPGLMLLGFVMLLVSFLVIFGMVLRVIEAGFLLSFGAYAVSFLGLLVGLAGIVGYGQRRH